MLKKTLKFFKRLMVTLLILIALFCVVTFLYMLQSQFGRSPGGDRLDAFKKSANFKDGKFQNVNHTPQITEGYSTMGVIYEFMFKKGPRRSPVDTLPSVKTDLLALPPNEDVLVWFGHSSYFIQLDGKHVLVDPVFSGYASPVPATTRSFNGTDRYTADDMPTIDYLFISHDHYDHLDYETMLALKSKVKKVICGLGVGAHLERWGYTADQIVEKDWHEQVNLDSGFVAFVCPARHFSGRGFSRNNTLWASYVLQSPTLKIYIGGDSGYDTHYASIGDKHGPIDLAILDNGQYDIKWKYIHNLPEEVLLATKDLKAKRLFPVHSSKFKLANHAWDEPLSKISALNQSLGIPILTPVIGERINLKDSAQTFIPWWQGLN